ncbi:hypothetical protein BGP78_13580 [Pseudoalteromonas sp. MSK9-3]|nr:hypothetical protein BGP78_13580 [Pseudoalteromonas sp. MSK9-3]
MYPDFVYVGDELVLDFGEAYEQLQLDKLTATESNSLAELDLFLVSHAGEKFVEHYVDNELLSSSLIWQKIRMLAAKALDSFGWEYVEPQKSDAIYIGNGGASS